MTAEPKTPGQRREEEKESLQPRLAAVGNEEGWRGMERCPYRKKEPAIAFSAFFFQPLLKSHLQ